MILRGRLQSPSSGSGRGGTDDDGSYPLPGEGTGTIRRERQPYRAHEKNPIYYWFGYGCFARAGWRTLAEMMGGKLGNPDS